MAKDRNKNINNLSFVERMMLCPINFCIYSFIITFAEKGETNKKLMGCGDWHVDKIVKGDELAFRFFVDTYSKDLYYFVLGYVHTREVAEEVVSDVFLEVWNNRACLGEIRQMKSWLLILARNKAISYLRKETPEVVSFDEIDDFYVPLVQSPDHNLISKEEIDEINRTIASLPPKCKEVFTLAKIEGLPYKEIAEMLDISVKTINIHIAKALNIIAGILRK